MTDRLSDVDIGVDSLLDTAPCGFVAFADDGTIRAANATLRELLGYGRDDLQGRRLDSILNLGSRIFYQTHFFPLVKLHGRAEEIFLLLRSKSGDDVATLCTFLEEARLDAIGVFGYSDEDGTEAASYDAKLDAEEVRDRVEHVTRLVEEITAQRAEDRIGEQVEVLVESVADDEVVGRAAHQGPEVDGSTYLSERAAVGDMVRAEVVGTDGVDHIAKATP